MSLTPKEYLLLEAIVQYLALHGRPPPARSNRWLMEQTGLSSNSISNLKRRLKEKGCLDENFRLTTRGENYLLAQRQASMQASLSSGSLTLSTTGAIPVRGVVQANPAVLELDGFRVEWDASDEAQAEYSGINLATGRDVVALRVTGRGLQDEGIYDGDWLVVEKWKSGLPRPGEMIVAGYLPASSTQAFRESEWGDFLGPIVAFFEEAAGEQGSWAGRLVWGRRGPYRQEITVHALRPIGKVVGLYREF